jgi:hypothetical protein
VDSLFQAYEARQRRRNAGPAALRNATYYLGKLDTWLHENGISPPCATADDLEDFRSFIAGRYAPTTANLAVVQMGRVSQCLSSRAHCPRPWSRPAACDATGG